jgi:hypothetical protein
MSSAGTNGTNGTDLLSIASNSTRRFSIINDGSGAIARLGAGTSRTSIYKLGGAGANPAWEYCKFRFS